MRWAIVIGIDDYATREPPLNAAVKDAVSFRRWLLREAGVPEDCVRTLLGRAGATRKQLLPTKDNVLKVINEVMTESGGEGEALYFFFAGHGFTSTYGNREESALVFPPIDEHHPAQTLAVRSIVEFFETTRFQDQFFFIDACRNAIEPRGTEIGGWQIPRRRQPGQEPPQQFILYATSPGDTAEDASWPEENSAFAEVLLDGLRGKGQAKAWSWERGCYEVRWERLASVVGRRMAQKRDASGEPFQMPQDVGVRGVEDRERDALLFHLSPARVKPLRLRLNLEGAGGQAADVELLDSLGLTVASAARISRGFHEFRLPPRTYGARVTTEGGRTGRFSAYELYDGSDPPELAWGGEEEDQPPAPYAPGTISIDSPDPLAVAEIRDESGRAIGIATQAGGHTSMPGSYRVRLVGPERDKVSEEKLIRLRGGENLATALPEPAVDERARELAPAFGGSSAGGYVTPNAKAQPAAWAQPSTIVAAGIGASLHGDATALRACGLEGKLPAPGPEESGIVFVAVRGTASDPEALGRLQVRIWPAGQDVCDRDLHDLPAEAGVAAVVKDMKTPERHWLSIETREEKPTVVALNPLKGRLATVVAQVDQDRIRIYQFNPLAGPAASSTPDRLRRLEHLQRQLLGGRVDGAREIAMGGPLDDAAIAARIDAEAALDPFGGCLVGYVLLRLGRHEWLGALSTAIIEAAPTLSDAYILRGEYEAHRQNEEASRQAYADAVNAGVPVFAEGLTRLVEGLLASGFFHPRGALVRYIFQRHVRGNMWAAFTPRGEFKQGRLVITGADIGYEG